MHNFKDSVFPRKIKEKRLLFSRAHLGVFEEEKLFAELVEADAGFEFGDLAGYFKDFAEAEAVVLNALSGLEVGHRRGDEIRAGLGIGFGSLALE